MDTLSLNNTFIIDTPITQLGVIILDDKIQHIEFLTGSQAPSPLTAHPLLKQLQQELAAYFTNPQYNFNLPFNLSGTEFQKRVFQALRQIPCGETRSYGELAKALNSSPRAVGNACRKNPLPILFPCHRVVAKTGIGGFAGAVDGQLIDIKQQLLKLEKATNPLPL